MSRPPKISPEQEPEVTKRYQAGETLQTLGLRFGCSDTSVGRVLKKNGIPLRPSHRRAALDPEQLLEAATLYKAGASTTELANRYGCTSKLVVKLLRKQGVETQKDPKIPLAERENLVSLYKAGTPLTSLAEKFDCSARTAAKALREAGVGLRPQGGSPDPLDPKLGQEILALRGRGLIQSAIAKQLGVSVPVVSRVLIDHGVATKARGAAHHSWKGGRAAADGGYVLVAMAPDHPFAQMRRSNGYCLEHRLVMAEHLGRPLRRSETVHHVNNNDKTDNRIENLQLRQGKHGKNSSFRCYDCGSQNIGPARLRDGPSLRRGHTPRTGDNSHQR
jgi:DNA invertase Pin-like site-specific DNA recombinase